MTKCFEWREGDWELARKEKRERESKSKKGEKGQSITSQKLVFNYAHKSHMHKHTYSIGKQW